MALRAIALAAAVAGVPVGDGGRFGRGGRVGLGGRLGVGVGGGVGALALADAVVGFAVGEDRPEVAQHGVGVHARPVALAQPRLGGGGEREQVVLALAAQALDVARSGAEREHDGGERGVEVGADAGGDAGAFARVGVERLQPGERAGVELADVLVDGFDVGPVDDFGERDVQPAGEVEPPAGLAVGGGREQIAVDRREAHAPAAGDDAVQTLQDRLGADVGGDLGAAPRVLVPRHLAHRPEADGAGRERAPEQRDRVVVGVRGRHEAGRGRGVGGHVVAPEGVGVSGGERAAAEVEPGLGEEARRSAGGAAAADVAAGEDEVVLGAGGGDVEQPPFLLEVLGVGALQ